MAEKQLLPNPETEGKRYERMGDWDVDLAFPESNRTIMRMQVEECQSRNFTLLKSLKEDEYREQIVKSPYVSWLETNFDTNYYQRNQHLIPSNPFQPYYVLANKFIPVLSSNHYDAERLMYNCKNYRVDFGHYTFPDMGPLAKQAFLREYGKKFSEEENLDSIAGLDWSLLSLDVLVKYAKRLGNLTAKQYVGTETAQKYSDLYQIINDRRYKIIYFDAFQSTDIDGQTLQLPTPLIRGGVIINTDDRKPISENKAFSREEIANMKCPAKHYQITSSAGNEMGIRVVAFDPERPRIEYMSFEEAADLLAKNRFDR